MYLSIVDIATTVATLCNLSQTSSITVNVYMPSFGYSGNRIRFCKHSLPGCSLDYMHTYTYNCKKRWFCIFCMAGSIRIHISPYSSVLCSFNFARSLCKAPAGGLTFCLYEKVKIAALQGSLAASVFPLLFVGNWKCSETG